MLHTQLDPTNKTVLNHKLSKTLPEYVYVLWFILFQFVLKYRCTCVSICRGQRSSSGVPPQPLSMLPLEVRPLTGTWHFQSRLGGYSKLQRSPRSPPPHCWHYRCMSPCPAYYIVSGDSTLASMLTRQVFHQLSHLILFQSFFYCYITYLLT